MQLLMTNLQRTYGLVVPEDEEITFVGTFKESLLSKSFEFCSKLFDVENEPGLQDPEIRIAIMQKNGHKSLVVKPSVFVGNAWIAIAPVLESDE